jgi:hypothetical protein
VGENPVIIVIDGLKLCLVIPKHFFELLIGHFSIFVGIDSSETDMVLLFIAKTQSTEGQKGREYQADKQTLFHYHSSYQCNLTDRRQSQMAPPLKLEQLN